MEFSKTYGRGVYAYLEQLLEVATKGNVTVEYSEHVNRMRLTCKVCQDQLTSLEPGASNELDYGVQEFIRLHAHLGGHGAVKSATQSLKTLAMNTYAGPWNYTTQTITTDGGLGVMDDARTKHPAVPSPKRNRRLLKIATGRKFR